MASAIAPPALGSVPEPNSSIKIKVFSSATRSMSFISSRNDEYVLKSFSMLWSSPMLTMMRSNTGSSEVSDVGMSMPHWNMYCSRPVVFRQTDLPPALGPEIKRICFCGVRRTVTGTISFCSRLRALSRRGCRAFRRFNSPLWDMTGIPALRSSAT